MLLPEIFNDLPAMNTIFHCGWKVISDFDQMVMENTLDAMSQGPMKNLIPIIYGTASLTELGVVGDRSKQQLERTLRSGSGTVLHSCHKIHIINSACSSASNRRPTLSAI